MLPISLRPNGRRAVIVGGGSVAARKAESLVSAGFPIFVVSERIGEALRALVRASGGSFAERSYAPGDLDDAALAIAATDDAEANARVVADARASHVMVCDAADPDRGDFTMTATRRAGDLAISVDSGGASPAFARRVASELAAHLDPASAEAVAGLAQMRAYVKEAFPAGERGAILRALAERPVAELASLPKAKLVCATRESALAMVQSRSVAARLARRGVVTTMLGVTTSGDRDRTRPLDRFDDVNVFVKELENALREHRAGYAVHSCKDLAGTLPDDMRIAAISARADARDAFCSERYESLESLPAGAVVGTSSPRRRAQLAALRPDLRYENLRGNVDTRLKKLARGEYDAIVLAMAGLQRLGVARRTRRGVRRGSTRAGRRPRRAGGRSTRRKTTLLPRFCARRSTMLGASSASFASALRCARCVPDAARRSASTRGWTARRCASPRSTRPTPKRRAESSSNARSKRSKKPNLWESPLRPRCGRPR